MSIYHVLMSMQVNPSSFSPTRVCSPDYDHSSVQFDLSMQQEICGIPVPHRSLLIPRIFEAKYRHVDADKMYFTDGSLTEESTGFGVFNEISSASYSLESPCSVYIAELAAIHCALDSIASRPVGHYFIVTDSLSSVQAIHSIKPGKHSPYFFEKIRDSLSALSKRRFIITFVWVPSHCSIEGNEKADSLAKVGAMEGDTYQREIAFNEFYFLVRRNSLVNWQRKWDEDELGRWLHSIIPRQFV
ncbi:uncharacterized protein LOC129757670 isoform X2 [Uranotaenia lowii]|uniref:uncharacterized protein LOC129757670 isoform X2 n=1 Tax=Uranotaenia lowii TaxID=190385 RepID=UPI002478ABF6|nr:uncharacterized protein LOC129757670 isoform X2 [Uranotaenia lowii]